MKIQACSSLRKLSWSQKFVFLSFFKTFFFPLLFLLRAGMTWSHLKRKVRKVYKNTSVLYCEHIVIMRDTRPFLKRQWMGKLISPVYHRWRFVIWYYICVTKDFQSCHPLSYFCGHLSMALAHLARDPMVRTIWVFNPTGDRWLRRPMCNLHI